MLRFLSPVFICLLWLQSTVQAEQGPVRLIFVLHHVPLDSPSEPIYLAADSNGWNPSDPRYRFQRQANGTWQLEFDLTRMKNQRMEFKLTRGSWANVEKFSDGSDRPNRIWSLAADGSRKALSVERWADTSTSGVGTQIGNVQSYADLWLPHGDSSRQIWVYLPPDYGLGTKLYRVLYMYDAQNLFDRKRAAFGIEWQIDETLEDAYYEGRSPDLIVVALENSARRACEYNVFSADPHPFCADGSALGLAWNQALVERLKPWVEKNFRVQGPSWVMGSSMGGQMSLALALQYPEAFNRAFALSPSYQNKRGAPLEMPEWIKHHPPRSTLRLYQDIGDREQIRELVSTELVANLRKVQAALQDSGLAPSQNRAEVIPGATHNEGAWALRFQQLVKEWGLEP